MKEVFESFDFVCSDRSNRLVLRCFERATAKLSHIPPSSCEWTSKCLFKINKKEEDDMKWLWQITIMRLHRIEKNWKCDLSWWLLLYRAIVSLIVVVVTMRAHSCIRDNSHRQQLFRNDVNQQTWMSTFDWIHFHCICKIKPLIFLFLFSRFILIRAAHACDPQLRSTAKPAQTTLIHDLLWPNAHTSASWIASKKTRRNSVGLWLCREGTAEKKIDAFLLCSIINIRDLSLLRVLSLFFVFGRCKKTTTVILNVSLNMKEIGSYENVCVCVRCGDQKRAQKCCYHKMFHRMRSNK